MDDSPYKYLCDLMCLPQGFSKGQDSYLCFRLFFVEKTDLKKLSRNNLKGYDVFFFSLFFCYQSPMFTEQIRHAIYWANFILIFLLHFIISKMNFDDSFILGDCWFECVLVFLNRNYKKNNQRYFIAWLHTWLYIYMRAVLVILRSMLTQLEVFK